MWLKNSKAWIAIGFVGLLVIGWVLGLDDYLNLNYVKSQQAALVQIVDQQPLLSATVYLVGYVILTAVSFPGATVLTLLGGALFGFWQGLLLISFASTLGATLAFLSARVLGRDAVNSRFADRLAVFNQGIARDGVWYLITLRLAPVVPFFLINWVMGLTPMSVWTFYWASQLGMLPGTMVYVNAGTQLAGVAALSDVMSTTVLLSLVALAVFPWIVRRVLQRFSASP